MPKYVTEKDLTYRSKAPILFFAMGLILFLILGWVVFPNLLYSSRSQPLAFNHLVHAKITDNGCDSCHIFRGDGSFSGIPRLETCQKCHHKIEKGGESEKRLITEYIEPHVEIPWLVYSRQPDHVYFSHTAHVILGELQCDTCHGDIGKSTSPKKYQENRLTGYSRDIWGRSIYKPEFLEKNQWDSMRMDDCVNCHLKKGHKTASVQTEKEGCFVCHK